MITTPERNHVEEEQGTQPAPPVSFSNQRLLLRRKLLNGAANKLVTFGGIFVIFCIAAILLVIIGETVPLFRLPVITGGAAIDVSTDGEIVDFVVDEYGQTAYTVSADGHVRLREIAVQPQVLQDITVDPERSAQIASSFSPDGMNLFLGLSDGRVVVSRFSFDTSYRGGKQVVQPSYSIKFIVALDQTSGLAISKLVAETTEGEPIIVGQVADRDLIVRKQKKAKGLMATSSPQVITARLTVPTSGAVTSFAIDRRGENLVVGSSQGELIVYDLRTMSDQPIQSTNTGVATSVRITSISPLIGDRTWIVADSAGRVQSWMFVKGGSPAVETLWKINDFEGHAAPVRAITRSLRNRSFVTADEGGVAKLHFGTSGETLLSTYLSQGQPLRDIFLSPRGNILSALNAAGELRLWTVDNPHPEISFQALFGRLWYEGYSEKAFVWQSTGGTDDFETKFSLIPLLLGTLKGTIFALLFAVPLAVLSALFVSQFMSQRFRAIVKPMIELMAALPSVVIGFIAGLWLAPQMEPVLPGVLLAPAGVTVVILVSVLLFRALPLTVRSRVRSGRELILLLPIVVLGLGASFMLGSWMEAGLLGSSYAQWLYSSFGIVVDQRNSVVVGVAMGFAIIPIIFTIAEESLSAVPKHLSAASLALGANRWETALRVVLPVATPGIFSAIMIGFGRAVGETMIVLMATGNTPILDFSPFNGFRALSANIAVELPEAPEGQTLFRILFLSALLLFALTFIVNTVTELIRLRLRERYKQL